MQESRHQPLYVGFYWTLPVRWKGFTQLSSDVDEAAIQSRTIRYQRAMAIRHASANNARIVDEVVYMEVDPEHGTHHVKDALIRVRRSCLHYGAEMVWVDFRKRSGWRGHLHLNHFVMETKLPNVSLFPEDLMIGTDYFDPVRHFRDWRSLNTTNAEERRYMIEMGLAAALECIPLKYGSYQRIADYLNDRGIVSQNGKEWTQDNVRNVVKSFISQTNNRD